MRSVRKAEIVPAVIGLFALAGCVTIACIAKGKPAGLASASPMGRVRPLTLYESGAVIFVRDRKHERIDDVRRAELGSDGATRLMKTLVGLGLERIDSRPRRCDPAVAPRSCMTDAATIVISARRGVRALAPRSRAPHPPRARRVGVGRAGAGHRLRRFLRRRHGRSAACALGRSTASTTRRSGPDAAGSDFTVATGFRRRPPRAN